MRLHTCLLSRECGGLWRVHLDARCWHLGVALRPADKFALLDGSSRWTRFDRKGRR